MAFHDMGVLTIHIEPGRAEVRFPFDKSLSGQMKKLGGKWSRQRRAWEFKGDDESLQALPEKVRALLMRISPKGWSDLVEKLRAASTITTEYTVRSGAAGVLIEVPPGGRYETRLGRLSVGKRAQKDSGPFMYWPSECMNKELLGLIGEIALADRELFNTRLFWLNDRSVRGMIQLSDVDIERFGMFVGKNIIAERSFVKAADPMYRSAPVKEYILKVDRLGEPDIAGKRELSYSYRLPERAYPLLQRRLLGISLDKDAIDVSHVAGTFETNFDDGGVFDV